MSARVHDYRDRHGGHDYTLTSNPDPVTARITGWGHGIREGDYLAIPRPQDGCALYRIEALRYTDDPPDMWFTTSRLLPGCSDAARGIQAAMQRPVVRPPGPFSDLYAGWWEL